MFFLFFIKKKIQNLQTWQIYGIVIGIFVIIGIIFYMKSKKNDSVTLYNKPDFKGESIKLREGKYTSDDIKLSGSIKSILVPENLKIEIYFDGDSLLIITGPGGSQITDDISYPTKIKNVIVSKKK